MGKRAALAKRGQIVPSQGLQQAGHAIGGVASFNRSSRVSRLLSSFIRTPEKVGR